jgi:hypothetical protein
MENFTGDFQLLAPSDGVVKDLMVNINEVYSGKKALGYVVNTESEHGLKVLLDKVRHKDLKKDMNARINLKGNTVNGEIYQVLKGSEWYMIIRAKNDIPFEFDDITGISVKQSSPDESDHLLIPCSALVQASSPHVYLLSEKKTIFGKEYYVQKKDIRVVDSNDKYASTGDLTPNDIVVTGWDRELNDGDSVVLIEGRGVQ